MIVLSAPYPGIPLRTRRSHPQPRPCRRRRPCRSRQQRPMNVLGWRSFFWHFDTFLFCCGLQPTYLALAFANSKRIVRRRLEYTLPDNCLGIYEFSWQKLPVLLDSQRRRCQLQKRGGARVERPSPSFQDLLGPLNNSPRVWAYILEQEREK